MQRMHKAKLEETRRQSILSTGIIARSPKLSISKSPIKTTSIAKSPVKQLKTPDKQSKSPLRGVTLPLNLS